MKYPLAKFLLLTTLVLLVKPCFSQQGSQIMDEYITRYSEALTSKNVQTIQSTIEYIDGLILENKAPVINAPYHKAQLEFKIGDIEKAINTLKSWKSKISYFYLMTIYLKTGKITEANIVIESLVKELIDDVNKNSRARENELNNIVLYYRTLNMDYSELMNDWIRKGIITQEDVLNAGKPENTITELMLESVWP